MYTTELCSTVAGYDKSMYRTRAMHAHTHAVGIAYRDGQLAVCVRVWLVSVHIIIHAHMHVHLSRLIYI